MAKQGLIYYFTGEDEIRKNLSIDKLKAKISLTSESPDYIVYDGKEAQTSDIIADLKTPPLLAKYRLVILKEADLLSATDKDKLISYFKNPADTSIFIIITAANLTASDRLDIAAKKYVKCLDFTTGRKPTGVSVFSLLEEIGLKKKNSALETLFLLTQSKTDVYEILGLMAWHMRRLGKTKILLDDGEAKEQIAQKLKVSYNTAQNIINQARNFTLSEIKRAQQLLTETDARLKKSAPNPRLLIEMLVMRLSSNL